MEKPLIYITRKIPNHLLDPFKGICNFKMWEKTSEPIPENILFKEAKEADGLLCLLTEKIDRPFLEANKHLKIIANMAVGYDNIDLVTAKEQDIIVTNTPDVLTEATADLTFALLMATARRLPEASKLIAENRWEDWSPFMLAGADIYGKTVGIVGMGRIGEAFARRTTGFNMPVLYHNRNRNLLAEESVAATYVSFDTLLKEADYVVSLVPLTKETYRLFDEEAFSQMKETAIFINASRGAVVDESALYNALVTKQIHAAGLDVFDKEPISASHPLVGLENAVLLPHIGSATVRTREMMITLCLENITAIIEGKNPLTPIG